MNFLIWLVFGGIVGWLATMVMKARGRQGLFLNVVVGVGGALLGGLVISPMVGVGTINQANFSLPELAVSLIGAVILLAIVNLVRNRGIR